MRSAARRIPASLLSAAVALAVSVAGAEPPQEPDGQTRQGEVRRGTIHYQPSDKESQLPERFRLAKHDFQFSERPSGDFAGAVLVSEVRFPSPVKTPYEKNNTVHCEFFQAKGLSGDEAGGKKKYPAVVVLHILGGDFALSRLFCATLASGNVSALFMKMPYYGPRKPPGVDRRMISADPRQTVEGMTQAVLDIRRAAAWLAEQPGVDPDHLGICGVSLGGITASLAAGLEPRFKKACPLLAGGDIARVAWESKHLERTRKLWIEQGGTRQSLNELMKVIDPLTYAPNARAWKTTILMLNASHDELIPKACTESLWEAFGRPKIVWYDAGHYTAMKYLLQSLGQVTAFFQEGDGK